MKWEPNKTRLAYTAKFLRSIGDYSKDSADRRCTYLGPHPTRKQFVRVRWDDQDQILADNAHDPEYCEHIRKNGSLVAKSALCKVGTVAFSD